MKVYIIGAGKMGVALGQRISAALPVVFYDKYPEKAQAAAALVAKNGKISKNPFEGASKEDIGILAIKPQDLDTLTHSLAHPLPLRFLVSILTGTTLKSLKSHFSSVPIVRMMPNLAVQTGKGVAALAVDKDFPPELKEEVSSLFHCLGYLTWIDEKLFDAVTSLTGSGPAFIFAMLEAMVESSIAMGFTAEEGYHLIKEMVSGSLGLLDDQVSSLSTTKLQICSPGGTTIHGLKTFSEKGVHSGIMETFLSAYHRAKALSKGEW